MRRSNSILIVVLGAPLLAGVGWAFARALEAAPSPERQATAIATIAAVQPPRLDGAKGIALRYIGAGGCAAAACHGDATAAETPSWKNSYSRWISQRDPHSFAYAVLKSDVSKRILWLLDGGQPDPQAERDKPWSNAAPHRDSRCLTCHSIAPDAHTVLPESLLADGVSCEGCHGPADSWIASHTTIGWLADGPKRYQFVGRPDDVARDGVRRVAADARMWNTKDPVSRANVCVRCHVGGPDRDVNHDLIAAGHPRLNFEYHAFMANLPRHWNDNRDRERLQTEPQSMATPPADYEARLWAIGQVASARSALGLLEQRVRSIQNQSTGRPEEIASVPGRRQGPIAPAWPELAEYSCYSCHHDIKGPRVAANDPGRRKRPLGSLPWGTWYFSEVQSKLFSSSGSGLPPLAAAVEPVRQAMEKPVALPKEVAAQLTAAGDFSDFSSESHGQRFSLADIERWLTAFGELPLPETWDEATQRYLALNAFAKSHRKFAGQSKKLDYQAIDRDLEEIRKRLQFEPGYQSPGHMNFDGLKQLHEQLLRVLELLQP